MLKIKEHACKTKCKNNKMKNWKTHVFLKQEKNGKEHKIKTILQVILMI
jgi:hypothetical protein